MHVTLNSLLIYLFIGLGLAPALATNEPQEFPSMGLATLDSGEMAYVTVRGNEEQQRQVREGYMDISRCYHNRAGLTCSKHLQAQRENIIYPAESLTINTQGVDRNISPGEVILTEDSTMMAVMDVFADGSIAGVPVEATRAPGYGQYRDWFRPISKNANIIIINQNDIKAVATDQFGIYKAGMRLQNETIAGMPLCEMHALRTLVRRQKLQQSTNETPCQHGTYYIHAMFSDGSFVKGASVLNPFPPEIQNYINSETWQSAEMVQ